MRLTNGASAATRRYMLDGIRYVCENFKDRASGTHSERKAQRYLANELSRWADNVESEDFDVHPYAYLGWIPISGILCTLSVILYWLSFNGIVHSLLIPFIAIVAVAYVFACFVFEFLMCKEFIDFMFPKKTSRNVMASIKPEGEIKRRIIFGGHTDAAYEWTYILHGGAKSIAVILIGSISGMFFITIFNIIWLFYSAFSGIYESKIWIVIGVIEFIFIPFFISVMFFINRRVIVDGANDNLTADFAAIAILKEMSDNMQRFDNTEVSVFLSGSEESGLRGAIEYAKRHEKELKQVETIFIAMDTLREVEQLAVITGGSTVSQKNSNAVGELIYEAGQNCGVQMPEAKPYSGSIDSEGFSRYGIPAAGFCGVDNHNPKTYYHTRLDTPDNISEECINLCLDICIEAATLYDTKGGINAFKSAGNERFRYGSS